MVNRGKRFTLRIGANELISMRIAISLDGRACRDTADRVVWARNNTPQGIWPDIGSKFSTVTLQTGSVQTSAAIKGRPGRGAITEFKKACSAVAKAIRYAH